MKIQTFPPEAFPKHFKYITPKQTHSPNLIEVKTGKENLDDCDGIWTKNRTLCLGVLTADCAPISFYNDQIFGIIHAGWRGCVNGIIEEMLKIIEQENLISSTTFQIGPIFPRFEIQKDHCYEKIQEKFGDKYFTNENQLIIFDFKRCLQDLIPSAQFDPRSTAESSELTSWRRDQSSARNLTLINLPPNYV